MATVAEPNHDRQPRPDRLSGTPRAHALDRWIYVITAASFIVIVLAGFIPSSLDNLARIEAGQRPPFPIWTHMHAVLMGSFLLLLLAQTTLVATGRNALHQKLGMAALFLAPAIVVVGFILASVNYWSVWGGATFGPPEARAQLLQVQSILDNILLLQSRIGILFPLFLWIGLRARRRDDGLHKRMMILAVAVALPAGIDRIPWLPTTMPFSPVGPDFWTMVAVSPMFAWDVIRNGYVHRAWWIWLGIFAAFAVPVHLLWDTPWWHATARALMGV